MKRALARTFHRSGAAEFALSKKRGVLVLMYHSVAPDTDRKSYPFKTIRSDFLRQIDLLSKYCDFVPLPSLLRQGGTPTAGRRLRVALTFDDGFRDNYEIAFPILEERGLPATLFLPTAFLKEGGESFLGVREGREMEDSGLVTVASHSHHHFTLTALEDEDLRSDLRLSKEILSESFSAPLSVLAYPGGSFDPRVKAIAADEGFTAAFRAHARTPTDRFDLPRVSIDERHRRISMFTAEIVRSSTNSSFRDLSAIPSPS